MSTPSEKLKSEEFSTLLRGEAAALSGWLHGGDARRLERELAGVAQICNLPYRRIAFCEVSVNAKPSLGSEALPIANRRYGRLQICATSNKPV